MSRPTRMHLPFEDWPAEDRIRWESAFKTGDRFDESGPGAHLAESTRRVQRESYARFLGFISTHHQHLMHLPPDTRIDRLLVADYVAWRRSPAETSPLPLISITSVVPSSSSVSGSTGHGC